MDKVLYYPYIDLPNNKWSLITLLYWDRIGSIVPHNYEMKENFDRFTKQLLDQGLIERVSPQTVTHNYNYNNSLIQAISKDEQILEKARKDFSDGEFQKIHCEKFHSNLFNQLVDFGIAQRVSRSDWFVVESKTSRFLMTFLASVLSIENGYLPATDNVINLDLGFDNFPFNELTYSEEERMRDVRSKILNDVIPFPMDYDLAKIRKFKDRYHEKLRSFRKHIEKTVFNISLIEDENKRQFAINREIQDINEQKEFLIRMMKEFNFSRIFFGGACGIAATAAPLIADPSLIVTAPLVYGLYNVFKDLQPQKIENPIHYLALIDRKINVKRDKVSK